VPTLGSMACCLVETRWFRVSMSVFWKAMLMSSRFRVASFSAICLSSAFSASASCVKSARSTASSRSWNGSVNPSDHGIWSSDCPAIFSIGLSTVASVASALSFGSFQNGPPAALSAGGFSVSAAFRAPIA
jgi:hypothetical protein